MSGINFSEKDMKNLALAWQCFETDPVINFKKFAALAGYTEGSAKVTMGALKRKLKSLSGDAAADSTPSTPKTPKTPGTGGRKRTAGTKDTPNEESPTKKLKGGKKAPAKGKGDDTFLQGGYDLDDDEEVKPMAMGTGSVVKKEEVDDEIQIV